MLNKFTLVGKDGAQQFQRNNKTRLVDVHKEMERKIRDEFTSTRYGASMMKMGWRVPGWDDQFFLVMDVAGQVGLETGSFGVDRFYILLRGKDMPVILDVKYEPVFVSTILAERHPNTKAWCDNLLLRKYQFLRYFDMSRTTVTRTRISLDQSYNKNKN